MTVDPFDYLFHACALLAFVEQSRITQDWPDPEATRRLAYLHYEEALGNRIADRFDNHQRLRYTRREQPMRGIVTEWAKRTQPIKVGDTVGYSKSFLQSTGQYTGDAPFARGKVTALNQLGSDITLAEIEWDKPDLPSRVNIKNLSTIKQIQLGE